MKLIHSTHCSQEAVHLELELLGLLPGEVLVGEVAVSGRSVVDGVRQVEFLDDDTGTQVEVVADHLNKFLRRPLRGAIRLDEEREGL
jgi:hypothetical protein